jgi:hypothetical protein
MTTLGGVFLVLAFVVGLFAAEPRVYAVLAFLGNLGKLLGLIFLVGVLFYLAFTT